MAHLQTVHAAWGDRWWLMVAVVFQCIMTGHDCRYANAMVKKSGRTTESTPLKKPLELLYQVPNI